jgi:hypothetical protein
VFDRVPGPLWVVNTKVFASNNGAADYHVDDVFGHDVAIQGDTVVAGAHGDVIFGVDNVGSAYVYKRTLANGWAQRLKVLASDGMYNDQFGVSVDVDGDTLVSGAFLDDAAGGDSGSAYAYVLRKDTYATYCLGDGSGAACPCTNNSTAGAAQGCKNSLGRGALLRPSGSTSIAANDLELYACNVPTGNACVLFGGMSTNGGLPFFAGLKCVPPPTVRLGLKSSSSTGYVAWGPGLNGGYWSAGQTWYYQVWYRDPTFTGCSPAKTTNLTNGVQVTF